MFMCKLPTEEKLGRQERSLEDNIKKIFKRIIFEDWDVFKTGWLY